MYRIILASRNVLINFFFFLFFVVQLVLSREFIRSDRVIVTFQRDVQYTNITLRDIGFWNMTTWCVKTDEINYCYKKALILFYLFFFLIF